MHGVSKVSLKPLPSQKTRLEKMLFQQQKKTQNEILKDLFLRFFFDRSQVTIFFLCFWHSEFLTVDNCGKVKVKKSFISFLLPAKQSGIETNTCLNTCRVLHRTFGTPLRVSSIHCSQIHWSFPNGWIRRRSERAHQKVRNGK